MPAPSTCTVSGTCYGPGATALAGVVVKAYVTTGFTDLNGNYIPAGVLASTTTAADGTWSLAVIRTQAISHSVTFQFDLPLGNSQSKSPKYAAVIPDTTTANFSDLVDLSAGTSILANTPTTDGLAEGVVNLYFTSARAAAAAPVQSVAGRTGAVVLTKTDVGLANVDNTADASKPVSTAQAAADAAVQAYAIQRSNHTGTQLAATISDFDTAANTAADARIALQRGANNGIASLDSAGKVPIAQLPPSVVEYKGSWDASTNTPTLSDGTGVSGYFYRVSVAGTQNLGSGSLTFAVGDWVIHNGSIWELSHSGSDVVQSVNGQTGTVVLTKSDIGLGNVSNVSSTAAATPSTVMARDSSGNTAVNKIQGTGDGTTPAFWVDTGGGSSGFYFGPNGTTFLYNTAEVFSFVSSVFKSNVPVQVAYVSSAGSPAIILSSDANSGFYRIGANNWGWSASSSKVLDMSSAGLGVTGALSSSGTATLANIIDSGLTADTVPYANSSKQLTSSSVTPTELGYVSGVTSAIQTQLGNKQPLDTELTAIAGLTSAADKGIQFTGPGTAGTFDLTTAGKALLDDADASAQRTTLGLGTIATQAANNVSISGGSITGITDLAVADGGTGASTLTSHGVLLGNGTSAVQALAEAAAGTLLGGVASSNPAFTATPTLGIAGTTKGTLALAGNTSGTVTIQPKAAAGTWTLQLPDSPGTNGYVLQTDGGTPAITSWVAQSGGGSAPNSSIEANTYAGYGSTNTKVPYFTNATTTGTDLTLTTNNSTSGFIATVNTTGLYYVGVDWNDANSAAAVVAIVVNGSGNYTTVATSLTVSQKKKMAVLQAPAGTNQVASTSWTGRLVANDTINIQTNAGVPANSDRCFLTICRIA